MLLCQYTILNSMVIILVLLTSGPGTEGSVDLQQNLVLIGLCCGIVQDALRSNILCTPVEAL